MAGLPLLNFFLSYVVFNVLSYFYAAAGKTFLLILYRVVLTLIELAIIFYVIYPFMKEEKDSPKKMIGYKRENLFSDFKIGIGLAVVAFVLNFIYSPIGDSIDPTYEQSVVDYFKSQHIALRLFDSIMIPITAGFVEEVVWRGYGYRKTKMLTGNFPIGILISSLSFAFVHGQPYVIGFAFLYGVVFCLAYERTKRLMPLMIGHWLYDFIQFLLLMGQVGF